MCSAVPGSIGRPHLARLFSTTSRKFFSNGTKIETPGENDFADVRNVSLLWNRMPPRELGRYPPDQQPLTISRREKEENFTNYLGKLSVVEDSMITLMRNTEISIEPVKAAVDFFRWLPTKCIVLGAQEQLPPLSDVIAGNRHIFRMVLDCFSKGNFEKLKPLTLGSQTLDFHRNAAFKLTEKQRSSLVVTEDDFVGRDGFVSSWNGINSERGEIARYIHDATMVPVDATGETLPRPYFMYSVILMAVRQKNNLFKMVRSLPFNPSPERMLLRMPPSYGFMAPRYVICRLDICHKVQRPIPMALDEDCLLYDFHIHSFS